MFSWLSRKPKLDALTADKLLQWSGSILSEYIVEEVKKRESGENSARQLAFIVLFWSGKTTQKVLNAFPGSSTNLLSLYLETKMYYDCLWQLYLLSKFSEEAQREKISYLATWVDISMRNMEKSAISSEALLDSIMSAAISNAYSKRMPDAIAKYIHGKGALHEDSFANSTFQLAMRLGQYAVKNSDLETVEAITTIVAEDTIEFCSITLLSQFDLARCEVLRLPDQFYEK